MMSPLAFQIVDWHLGSFQKGKKNSILFDQGYSIKTVWIYNKDELLKHVDGH